MKSFAKKREFEKANITKRTLFALNHIKDVALLKNHSVQGEALQKGDIDKLMACWSDDDDVVCVHPGGPRLVGIDNIRQSFENMFSNGVIDAHPEHVRKVETVTSAMHNLVERIELNMPQAPATAFVLTTNVYVRTAQGWRMVAHHASPGTPQEIHARSDALPPVLH